MRLWHLFFGWVIALTYPVGAAAQDCAVIAGIERVAAAHQRITETPATQTISSDARLLAQAVSQLSSENIAAALAGAASLQDSLALQAYISDLRSLPALAQTADAETIKIILTRTNAAQSLPVTLDVLRRLSCDDRRLDPFDTPNTPIIAVQNTLNADQSPQHTRGFSISGSVLWILVTLGLVVLGVLLQRVYLRTKSLRKRRGKRYLISLPTYLRLGQVTCPARVMDISCRGAKLRCSDALPIAPGHRIQLALDDDWHTAFVSWCNPHYCGVQFDRPLRFSKISALLDDPAPLDTPPGQSKRRPI